MILWQIIVNCIVTCPAITSKLFEEDINILSDVETTLLHVSTLIENYFIIQPISYKTQNKSIGYSCYSNILVSSLFISHLEFKLLPQKTNSAPYSLMASHFTLAVHFGTTTVHGHLFVFPTIIIMNTGKYETRKSAYIFNVIQFRRCV